MANLGVWVAISLAAFLLGQEQPPKDQPRKAKELQVGESAPDFEMKGSDGKSYGLKQFRGKRGVVLVWFPKAFTGG